MIEAIVDKHLVQGRHDNARGRIKLAQGLALAAPSAQKRAVRREDLNAVVVAVAAIDQVGRLY